MSLLLLPAFLVWAMPSAAGAPQDGRLGDVGGRRRHPDPHRRRRRAPIRFTGDYDYLKLEHPAIFNTLEDVTSPFATVATMIGGKPQIARIDDGPLPVTTATGNIGFSEDHANASLAAVRRCP